MQKDRNRPNGWLAHNGLSLLCVVLTAAAVCLLGMYFYLDQVKDIEPEVYYEQPDPDAPEKIVTRAERQLWVRPKDPAHVADVLSRVPGIVCWGDSLTAGSGGGGNSYPVVLAGLLAKNGYVTTTVVNMGVAGESTREIRARSGAFGILLQQEIVIPAGCEPVQVSFLASDGYGLELLRLGSAGMTNVSICGIEGTLSAEWNDDFSEGSYWFTRKSAGLEKTVPAGTQIINDGSYLYKDYLPIIFVGQNGKWGDTPAELIRQQHEILDTCEKNKDKFLMLGLTSGDAQSRAELEKAMEAHWGRQYVNLRQELCDESRIAAQGLSCTQEDYDAMAQGRVPPILMSDEIHLNGQGYAIVGAVVFERLVELGFVEK